MSSTESPDTATAALPVPPAGPGRHGAAETVHTVALPGLTLTVRAPVGSPAPQGGGAETGTGRDREPALYVHGLGGSSQNWSDLMPLLADRVDGEAIDLPGFGHSPPPDDGNYSVSAQARAVIRYLDAAGRGPVHLIGNSMGGAAATRVAAVRPDLVRTLTLISPALPELRPQLTAVPTALLAVPGITGLFGRLTHDWTPERRTREVLALCYGDPGRVSPEGFNAAVDEYARRLELPYFWEVMERSARGLVNAYTLGGQHNLWRQAERVLAPTLLVYGGRDRLVSFRMARRAAAAFRGSRLLTLPEAGHVAMMEYPETVARAVRELLDSDMTDVTADASRS
ncbi:alpha/beta hydrolase [Streptomyces platensis]|uniref:Alpha/beta hydrolase n=1 Tax=Streptomyces platensis TaxID=58346 RepID=A0AAE6NLK7_STRPT|nr:alpha/beta hydrolase [Streptomyces platensis]OSY45333.1 Dihydrolipoyllysine-residue acetyltransferase component of acetoin cleaving system [Streptomyces platensis]QEV54566.1 alpha/beta hydrolase [Streptomyces platensis]